MRKIRLSGRTQFPHVHVFVRHNGNRIGPFAPSGRLTCHSSVDTLGATPLQYDAGGLLSLRFFDHLPKIETLRFGREASPLTNQSLAIVIAAFGFGVQKGDIVTLRIDGPRSIVFEHSDAIDRNQAQFMRSGGNVLGALENTTQRPLTRDGQMISELKSAITVP